MPGTSPALEAEGQQSRGISTMASPPAPRQTPHIPLACDGLHKVSAGWQSGQRTGDSGPPGAEVSPGAPAQNHRNSRNSASSTTVEAAVSPNTSSAPWGESIQGSPFTFIP